MPSAPILEVDNLRTHFRTPDGDVPILDGISLSIAPGEIVGIVGESGSGKSVTALSIMRLVRSPGRIVGGRISYAGRDLAQVSEREMRSVRGASISMIFQDPMTFLNPIMTIGDQIGEVVRLHRRLRGRALTAAVVEALRDARVPAPERIATFYPHQLSGGMRQRVLIAVAIACSPNLLIADEPTTALDVTIQAQILQILRNLVRERQMALLLITHDLGVVAGICDRVYVMYAGQIIEEGDVVPLFEAPRHPYTQGLLRSIASVPGRDEEHPSIEGHVPNLAALPTGCRFHPRCDRAMPQCREKDPIVLFEGQPRGEAACWLEATERQT